jgi:hypothetical protein
MPNTPINILSANPDENETGIHAGINWGEHHAQVYMAIPLALLEEQIRVVRATDPESSDTASLYFYTGPLTRYEMNSTVKNMRRARDRVYGRDE